MTSITRTNFLDFLNYSGSEMKPKRRRKNSKAESSSGFRKRKLTDEQVNMLELHFQNEHKLESERKDRLAAELGLDPRQVAVWFQNRRTRYKSKKLEEEYSRLKSEHESAVFEKCQLKTEVSSHPRFPSHCSHR